MFLRLRAPALPPGDLLHPLARGIEWLRGACYWRLPETPDWASRMHGLPRTIGELMTTRQTGAW